MTPVNFMPIQNIHPAPHRKLTPFVFAAFLTSFLLIGGLAFDSYRFLRNLRQSLSLNHELSMLGGVLIHLDEVLAMSARMAAVTGDLKWETRYRKHEAILNDAIKRALTLVPEKIMLQTSAMTDEANLELVTMENASFEMVRKRNMEEARRILFSPAYEKQKAIYASGIEKVAVYLDEAGAGTARELRDRNRAYIVTAGAIMAILVFIGLAVIFFIKRTEKVLFAKNDELERYARQLSELNDALDLHLVERTHQAMESEERNRLTVESANDAFIAIDAGGGIREWNHQAELMFGWAFGEVQGRRLAETIIPERYRQAHLEGVKRFLETGTKKIMNQRVEISALHKDGREFPVALTVWPIRVGEAVQFNAFIRDIRAK